MSERILKALMQLFALVADVDDVTNKSRNIVQLFLKQQLNQELVDEYLKIYDEYLEAHHQVSQKKDSKRKRTSLNSVKVLKICTQINSELAQKQKVVVVLRLLEYLNTDKGLSEQAYEFASTVAETFNISRDEFESSLDFITCKESNIPDRTEILVVSNETNPNPEGKTKQLYSESLEGKIVVLSTDSVNMYSLRYFGTSELYLNGQILNVDKTYILTQGSSIRSSKVHPIYYSDIISRFLSDKAQARIVFSANQIEYEFKGGKKGLNSLTFSEESGKLLGIMGGSGAGKSTLLNVLNGNAAPSSGVVLINNINIHTEKDQIEGVIGYVSQDDLLIEELTVFQNLFYNAKLCFEGFSDKEIAKRVLKTLNSLGLYETKDLKVGNPLEKTISGGQRKRLNIALELIREPSVLFVDEPTSGLSSRDSENIMHLLKQLALKGKVVFVVIHQPSSEIYKMFDKLLILDVGGYPIYYGNPVDAVIYFKKSVNHVKSDESECVECGNVNPEQVFNIIESKVLDEYGNLTDNRKVSSKEWNDLYKEKLEPNLKIIDPNGTETPKSTFNIPNKIKQFKVFTVRDVLSKMTNKQYLMINLLESPALALILAYFIKFFDSSASNQSGYIYHDNENIPVYMFMAVVVALFVGLTVSAEEIIKDQKIRKRESFLNLSKGSYLVSKILIMFFLSAIQTMSFIVIGNLILGIKDMWLDYWIVLFSTACFANMLGLNISSAFNSAVTIYILIPFLIIPQLLFSGVMVKFDKLNPNMPWASQTEVPIIGELMASRWAFEALAVNQFKNNKFERRFYELDKDASIAAIKKNYWIPAISRKLGEVETNLIHEDKKKQVASALALLRNELGWQIQVVNEIQFNDLDKLNVESVSREVLENTKKYLDELKTYYTRRYNAITDKKDGLINEFLSTDEKKQEFNKLKNDYVNESLDEMVKNKSEYTNLIFESEDRLIQKTEPIFLDPEGFRAHFYAPRKKLFGSYVDTFWANILVLWVMSVLLMVTLYYDILRKLIDWLGGIGTKLSRSK